MRFLLLVGAAGLLAFTAQAQSPVRGKVLDAKDQSPLPGANVVLTHLPDSVKTGTAVSGDGSFQLDNVAAGRYLVTVSFIGYRDQRQPLTVPAGGQPVVLGNVPLQAGTGVALNTVQVTGQQVTVQRGDTTSVDAKSFKVNPDATASDLINKMPGIQVDAQGKTQAQGEQVQQVLVDGKPFFGTDPDAVLKNLPAEAIDRVEIFDQMSEQSRFSGFNDGNTQKTLNIITKPQFRNGQFGRFVGGVGPNGGDNVTGTRYRASLNLNDFHDNRRITVLAQSNNVNEQNFGTDDLLGVVGNSAAGGGGRGGSGTGGGGGGNAGDFLVSQNGGISTTHAAGLNYSNSWNNKKTELTGSYFFNRSNNALTSTTNRQFANTASTLYRETSSSSSINYNHRANFRLEHQLDSATSLLFRPRLSWQQNDANKILGGVTSSEGNILSNINTLYNANNRAINPGGDLLLRRRLGHRVGRTLSLNISGSYTDRDGSTLLRTTSTSTNLNQQSVLAQRSGSIGTNLAYTEPVGQHAQLQANYALSYAPNNSDKRTYDFQASDQRYSRLDTALSNVFNNHYLTQGGGLSYRYNTRTLQVSIGVTGQVAQLRGDQTFPVDGPVRYTFWNILPQAMLMFRPDRQHNIRVFYRTNTSAPSINQLQAVVNNSNPLQLTIGNPGLRQEYQHNLVARYTTTNPERSGSFFALLSGSYTQDPISNRTVVASRDTTFVPDNATEAIRLPAAGQLTQSVNLTQEYSVRALANYGQPFFNKKLNANASLGGSYSQTPGLVNGGLNYARTPALTGALTLSSNISERLDFTLSSNSTKSFVYNTLNIRLNSNYFSQLTRLRLSWIVGPGISIQSDVAHQLYRGLSSAYNQNYALWNASIGKKIFPGQRGEIKLYAFDLLAQNRAIQRNVTAAYVEDVQTTVLQRYFMLMFTYNIRSANMTVPTAPEGPGGGRRGRGGFDGPPDGGSGPGGGGSPGGGGFGGPPGG